MLNKKNKYFVLTVCLLIFSGIFSLPSDSSTKKYWKSSQKYSSWAKKRNKYRKYSYKPIRKKSPAPIPSKYVPLGIDFGTPFFSNKNEVNNAPINGKDKNSLIRDYSILEHQLNLVNKEFYQTKQLFDKSLSNVNFLKKNQVKLKEKYEQSIISKRFLIDLIWTILIASSVIVFILFLVLLAILNKYKTAKQKLNKNFSKIESFKIFDEKIDKIFYRKLGEFDEILENNFSQFNHEIHEDNSIKLKRFEEALESILQKQLRSLEPVEFSEEIRLNLLPGNGYKAREFENLMAKFIKNKLEKYLKILIRKEKIIISNIQKTHLSISHFNNGNFLLKNKNYVDAAEEYKDAIKVDSTFFGAYINLANAYELSGKNTEAELAYKDAIKVKPSDYKAYFNLANLLGKGNRYIESTELYKTSLELNPQNFKAYNNLGNSYRVLKRFEEAKKQYEKAIFYNRDYAEAYFNLSLIECILNNNKPELVNIAENYLNKYNASKDTQNVVKNLILEYSDETFDKIYSESNS